MRTNKRKRGAFLGLRMTEVEKQIIFHFARQYGLSASEFVRRIAIEYVARRAISLNAEKNGGKIE